MNKSISSINLSCLPFMGSCDTTRAQMAAKQISQSLTHLNCEIPYVISEDYRHMTENSSMGIYFAKDDGIVVFKNFDIIIVYYNNLKKLEVRNVPYIKKTAGQFASTLRYILEENNNFTKGEIIYSYDNFRSGIPSFGYNVFCGYLPFFGYNFEDSLIVSESLANKAKCNFTEIVYIPIFEYTSLQPVYQDYENSFIYFPGIGQKLKDNIVATKLQPKTTDTYSNSDLKQKMLVLLKSLNLSDLLNVSNKSMSAFTVDQIKTKVDNGSLTGIKVHKLQKDVNLVDAKLQKILEELYKIYSKNHAIEAFNKLSEKFNNNNFAAQVIRKHLIYNDKEPVTNRRDISNCIYLIELEVSSEHESVVGDKLCNRYANKGIVSIILPNELRPVALQSNMPIDLVFNPFGKLLPHYITI